MNMVDQLSDNTSSMFRPFIQVETGLIDNLLVLLREVEEDALDTHQQVQSIRLRLNQAARDQHFVN